MRIIDMEEEERKRAHETLVRLANSCEPAAARGKFATPIAPDLNEEDYHTISEILRDLARTIADRVRHRMYVRRFDDARTCELGPSRRRRVEMANTFFPVLARKLAARR